MGNFAYDPYNYTFFRQVCCFLIYILLFLLFITEFFCIDDMNNHTSRQQLNVLELFLDCLTEPNENLVEFAVGGICNACAGTMFRCHLYRLSVFPVFFCIYFFLNFLYLMQIQQMLLLSFSVMAFLLSSNAYQVLLRTR